MKKGVHKAGWVRQGVFSLCLGFGLCTSMSFAGAEPYAPALKAAIELCLTLPNNSESIEANLIDAGWERDDSERALFKMLSSATFAFRYATRKTEDIGFLLRNSDFMAASILGNSALPRNQPSYLFDDISLSTIGLTRDTPYCILTGPIQLKTALDKIGVSEDNTAGDNSQILHPKESLPTYYTLEINGIDVAVAIVDTNAISEKLTEFSPEEYRRLHQNILSDVRDVNIHINPAKSLRQKVTP